MNFDSAAFSTSTPRERIAMCRAFAAEATGQMADAKGNEDGYAGLPRAWSLLATEIAKLTEARMKPDDASAIADFLNRGGEILRVPDPIPVTEQELLVYLASCELSVKYFPGDLKPYGCNRRRYTANGLLRIANTYRRDQNLSPLML